MKDSFESPALGRTQEAEGFSNRKLIRPSLSRSEHVVERRERPSNGERANTMERAAAVDRTNGKKTPPPEQTHAENFYYQKQMQAKTPMVVVLKDGETMQGVIEWYDRNCIKINRTGGQPNVLIYKPSIKYMFKQEENHKG